MEGTKLSQGAILIAGTGLISSGAALLVARDVFGVLLIAVGAALVYWREMRKA